MFFFDMKSLASSLKGLFAKNGQVIIERLKVKASASWRRRLMGCPLLS